MFSFSCWQEGRSFCFCSPHLHLFDGKEKEKAIQETRLSTSFVLPPLHIPPLLHYFNFLLRLNWQLPYFLLHLSFLLSDSPLDTIDYHPLRDFHDKRHSLKLIHSFLLSFFPSFLLRIQQKEYGLLQRYLWYSFTSSTSS